MSFLMYAIGTISRKMSKMIRVRITSDFMHLYFVRLVLRLTLHNRDLINGEWNGNKSICLSFDCDFPEDMEKIPSLLEVLNAEEINSSFALVGRLVNRYPTIVNKIIEEGHEVVNHSFSHPEDFARLGRKKMEMEITYFQELMIESFNYRPEGFRVPHVMRRFNKDLFDALKEADLYDSSYIGQGVSKIGGVVEVALTSCPEHPQLSFDFCNHFQLPFIRSSVNKFLKLWITLLNKEQIINIYFDPHTTSNRLLRKMIQIGKKKGFSFLRMVDIVRHYMRV